MAAKKQEWTVRVIMPEDKVEYGKTASDLEWLSGLWVEQLRYMGHARELADFDTYTVIEFYAPYREARGTDTKVWADQNAERMRSFGINAAAAPKWVSGIGKSLEDEIKGAKS